MEQQRQYRSNESYLERATSLVAVCVSAWASFRFPRVTSRERSRELCRRRAKTRGFAESWARGAPLACDWLSWLSRCTKQAKSGARKLHEYANRNATQSERLVDAKWKNNQEFLTLLSRRMHTAKIQPFLKFT